MELLPCPFCGSNNLGFAQGSTHRWLSVICHDCGAASGEVRKEILCSEFTVGDKQRATEEWNRRTSPASVPAGQSLWDSVYKTLRGYRMTMMVDSEGDGYPLIDAMSPEHGTVTSGIEECTYLADAIYNDLVAAAPTTPVQGDRKDADLWRDLVSHQKFNNVPAVGYAINRAKERQAAMEGSDERRHRRLYKL